MRNLADSYASPALVQSLKSQAHFPPRRDFSSLSVRDLIEAREAYHVHLSNLENVIATAVGRYLIRVKDWYADHAPNTPRPPEVPKPDYPRTLVNSVVRPWSWPAVIVFVREWKSAEQIAAQAVPRALYLPDGRVIPTCVVLATPDESPPPPSAGPSQVSPLLGGGYSCLRRDQQVDHLGTFACLVYKNGRYYALTNRHVAGPSAGEVQAFTHGAYHRIGTSTDIGLTKVRMSSAYAGYPNTDTFLAFDAGLVQLHDFNDWTSQVWGIGEIGETFDATSNSLTLDLIGLPVRAFGGTSGMMEGEIRALLFRYKSQGGYDYATDVLIGPRLESEHPTADPLTRPGDSGSLWFYDPPAHPGPATPDELGSMPAPERGTRARRLRPLAMQWGGQRFRLEDGSTRAFALASFVSTICRELDVDIVRNWSIGHDEYWGKLGHFAIGWKACDQLAPGPLSDLMSKNQARIGYGDETLGQGAEFRQGRDDFVPLADVPDYVWIFSSRTDEPVQHFADVDIQDINGGASMLDRCHADPTNVSATKWKTYFDGFAAAGVGPDDGTLPFRVWQVWDAMVDYLRNGDVMRFVAAAGVLAHYVGDASQPLHCSYMHHGRPPTMMRNGRQYPVRKDSPEFAQFKTTRAYAIHGLYEETMLEVDTATALADVNIQLQGRTLHADRIQSGHDAAVSTVELMFQTQRRLSPATIIDADKPSLGPKARAERLWQNQTVRDATIESLADSVVLLAELWTSAWRKGGGDNIAAGELRAFGENELQPVYRHEADFVPSLSLDEMASSGKFEPPGP